jgi:hypothetical protein
MSATTPIRSTSRTEGRPASSAKRAEAIAASSKKAAGSVVQLGREQREQEPAGHDQDDRAEGRQLLHGQTLFLQFTEPSNTGYGDT